MQNTHSIGRNHTRVPLISPSGACVAAGGGAAGQLAGIEAAAAAAGEQGSRQLVSRGRSGREGAQGT